MEACSPDAVMRLTAVAAASLTFNALILLLTLARWVAFRMGLYRSQKDAP